MVPKRLALYKGESTIYAASLDEEAEYYGFTKETVLRSFYMIRENWNTGETYTGTVSSLGDFPKQDGSYGNGNPNSSYYPFMVYVDGSADLQSGSYVSIIFSAGSAEQGVYLENPFLRTENGRSYIWVRGEDGTLQQRFVTTGKSLWGSYTQILEGLGEEDFLAFPYGKNLKNGAETVESDISALYG